MRVANCLHVILILCINGILCKFSPGLKLHVTRRGVAAIVANFQAFIDQNIRLDHEIADHSEQKWNFKFEIKDAKVESLQIGSVAIATGFTPESTIIQFRNLDIQARSTWRYEVQAGLKIRDRGNVKAEIRRGSVDLIFPRAMMVDRRPYVPIVEIDCGATLPELVVDFEGARATLYNILKPLFVSKVKAEIQQIVCLEAKHLLKTYLEEKLDIFHTEYLLTYRGQRRPLLLDYTFLSGPLLSPDLIVSDHVGTVYPVASERPLLSSDTYRLVLPARLHNSTAHMHYMISDAYFNALLYTLFEENVVRKFKLNSGTLKEIFQLCTRETCGAMYQQMVQNFQAKSIAVTLELLEPATFVMSKHHAPSVTSDCYLNFIITLPNNTHVQVFTAQLSLNYSFHLAVDDRGLVYSSGVVATKSNLIKVTEAKIDTEPATIVRFVKILNDLVLTKYVNQLINIGLRLPVVEEQRINVVGLEILNNYLVISVNWL